MPLLLPHDACTSCGAPIVRSFATFEPLPVVEFELADGITEDEAAALLASEPQLHCARWYFPTWIHASLNELNYFCGGIFYCWCTFK